MQKFEGTKPHPVAIEGFILGTFYKEGERVDLNWWQSREFLREGRVLAPGGSVAKAGRTAKTKD